jgi:hypothetical protein
MKSLKQQQLDALLSAKERFAQTQGYVSIKGKSVPIYNYDEIPVAWKPAIASYIMWSRSFETNLIKENLAGVFDTVLERYMLLRDAAERLSQDDSLKAYVEEAKAKVVSQKLRPLWEQIAAPLDNALAQFQKTIDFATSLIWEVTDPPQPQDAILAELKAQEIRRLLRAMPVNERSLAIGERLADGDLTYLHAVITAPDNLLDDSSLKALRQSYAQGNYDWLFTMKEHYEKLARAAAFVLRGVETATISALNKYGLKLIWSNPQPA